MNQPDFWDNATISSEASENLANLKKSISQYQKVKENLTSISELFDISEEEMADEIRLEIEEIKKELDQLEIITLFSGEHDSFNCYLEIHPGAGGTESCDWASMLARMYIMFCEKNDYKYEIIDEQKGDEAGIKNMTILIKGFNAYGYFKNEIGVHRLVRISPFDSSSRRHTSFASISVIPEFDKNINIEINENDLKIDVYRSSGAGGQSVNTTDSAVRITHLPSKIVVTCQNERSQIKNKEQAMTILKSKLYQQVLEQQAEELANIKGIVKKIDFGSQIRSYILEPYKLVKDHRTNYETSNTEKVLDGYIKEFMESVLKQ